MKPSDKPKVAKKHAATSDCDSVCPNMSQECALQCDPLMMNCTISATLTNKMQRFLIRLYFRTDFKVATKSEIK